MKKFLSVNLFLLIIRFCSAQITINEVTYDPIGNDGGSMAGEWIELYCNGGGDCDISCYVITDGDWTITIPDGTIVTASDFYVIGNASYANTPDITSGSVSVNLDAETCGCTTGSSIMGLTNTGEFVAIYNDVTGFIEGVVYESPSSGNQPINAGDIISATITGCSTQTLDIDGNNANFDNVGSGGDNTIAKDIDGIGTWEYRDGSAATPGETNATPTPVTLTSFTAKPMDTKTVTLNWATASEENNEYFSVEHSVDGRDFVELERVAGFGTTTQNQYYQFMHREAVKGSNYYRLRQVDFDGTFSFSEIEVVVFRDQSEISVRPTLAQQSIEVSTNEDLDIGGSIEVINWIGQVVVYEKFSAKSTKISLDVGGLESGHYVVRVNIGTEIKLSRFVKL